MEGPTVTVVVIGDAPKELAEGLIRVIKEYLGEDSHTLLEVSESVRVRYTDFRRYCVETARTRTQEHHWASRGWADLIALPALEARCEHCLKRYGKCKCKDGGEWGVWSGRRGFVANVYSWDVSLSALLALTQEDLMHIENLRCRERLEGFVQAQRTKV